MSSGREEEFRRKCTMTHKRMSGRPVEGRPGVTTHSIHLRSPRKETTATADGSAEGTGPGIMEHPRLPCNGSLACDKAVSNNCA